MMSKNILLLLIAFLLLLSLKHAFSISNTAINNAKSGIKSNAPNSVTNNTTNNITGVPKKTDFKKTGKTDPKKVFSKDEYSLYKSVYLGRTGKVEKLIQSGVNVNVHSPNSHRSPLHLACSRGKTDIVKVLIDGGANMEFANTEGKTPMYFAIENSRAEVIKFLHSKGAKITQDMINAASTKIKSILTGLTGLK